jgi:hypothetical protein
MKTTTIFIFTLFFGLILSGSLKAQSEIIIYTDNFGPGISNSFFPNTDGTMGEVSTQYFNGTKSLEWFVGTKPYADLKFTVWPVKDLSSHVASGFNLEFYFKSPSVSYANKMYLKCYFRSKIGTNPAYDCTFNLTPTQLVADGEWHKVSLPLTSFVNATGNFTWTDVNFVNIYTDHTNLNGATLYFDEIKVSSTILSNIQHKADMNDYVKIYPNVVKGEANIIIGDINGNLKLYSITGKMVHDFGNVRANSEISWNGATNLPEGIYYCKFDNIAGGAVKLIIQH